MMEARPDRAHVTGKIVRPKYSQAERLADAIIHVTGVTAALLAVPTMITLAAVWSGEASIVAAAVIYGTSLIAMLTFSACYHMTRHSGAREILRRLDHASIYVVIAGTYTPFAVLLAGPQTAAILIGIWGAALTGIVLKLAAPHRLEIFALALYLAMGWSIVVIGGPILDQISTATLVLMLTGGGLYTLGVVFHLWQRLMFHNAIWHGLVLVASFVFYAAVMVEVTRAAAG
jgi:hemolysin III